MKKKNKLLQSVKIIILGLVFSLGVSFAFSALQNPVPRPLNVSSSPQIKDGGLSVDQFFATGNYLHFMQSIKMDILAGGGKNKPICADEDGYIILCPTPPVITIPTVTTSLITNITQTSAVSGGTITNDGGAPITQPVGITVWDVVANSAHGYLTTGWTIGVPWVTNITGLSPDTTYRVRAYATNSAGVGYGEWKEFKTPAAPVITAPTVTTSLVTNVTQTTATGGGNVTSDGGATVTARGVIWTQSIDADLTIGSGSIHTTSNGTGTGTFTSNMTNLVPNTPCYVRAYATNSAGTGYGAILSFSTSPIVCTSSGNQTFNSSTTYTVPQACRVDVKVWGAGGGGGGGHKYGDACYSGGGGAGGNYSTGSFYSDGQPFTIIVGNGGSGGAGGVGGNASTRLGKPGDPGNSSEVKDFGQTYNITAYGGNGGGGGSCSGGGGGTHGGGGYNIAGVNGQDSSSGDTGAGRGGASGNCAEITGIPDCQYGCFLWNGDGSGACTEVYSGYGGQGGNRGGGAGANGTSGLVKISWHP
jgi:hypothetical protein